MTSLTSAQSVNIEFSGSNEQLLEGDVKRVALIGDSLLNRPFNKYNLCEEIQKHVSPSSLIFTNHARDGSVIADILKTQISEALSTRPDVIILCWDSDCSNFRESEMSAAQVQELRARYTEALKGVLKRARSASTSLIVAGPCLLSEGCCFRPARFAGKDRMLADYRDINYKLCRTYNVPYVDIRTLFFRKRFLFGWWFSRGYLTEDGEHFSARGTRMLAGALGHSLNRVLQTQGDSLVVLSSRSSLSSRSLAPSVARESLSERNSFAMNSVESARSGGIGSARVAAKANEAPRK